MNKEGGQATSRLYDIDQKKGWHPFTLFKKMLYNFYVLGYIPMLGYIASRLGTKAI